MDEYYYNVDFDNHGHEVIMDAAKGVLNYCGKTKKILNLGDKGFKSETEKMTPTEKELYNTFDKSIQKYTYLIGLTKHNDYEVNEIEEHKRYLVEVAMLGEKDRSKIAERIILIDKIMSEKVGCDYETLYNSNRNIATFFHPTTDELTKQITKIKTQKRI